MPVAPRNRAEKKILAAMIDQNRVRPGTVGNVPPSLLEVVLVIQIERIAVRLRGQDRLPVYCNISNGCQGHHRSENKAHRTCIAKPPRLSRQTTISPDRK